MTPELFDEWIEFMRTTKLPKVEGQYCDVLYNNEDLTKSEVCGLCAIGALMYVIARHEMGADPTPRQLGRAQYEDKITVPTAEKIFKINDSKQEDDFSRVIEEIKLMRDTIVD